MADASLPYGVPLPSPVASLARRLLRAVPDDAGAPIGRLDRVAERRQALATDPQLLTLLAIEWAPI